MNSCNINSFKDYKGPLKKPDGGTIVSKRGILRVYFSGQCGPCWVRPSYWFHYLLEGPSVQDVLKDHQSPWAPGKEEITSLLDLQFPE